MNEWMSLAVSWLPFLLLIGVWFWLSRRSGMQARTASRSDYRELYEQQLTECRHMNLMLERIAASLEKTKVGRSRGPNASNRVQQERRNTLRYLTLGLSCVLRTSLNRRI